MLFAEQAKACHAKRSMRRSAHPNSSYSRTHRRWVTECEITKGKEKNSARQSSQMGVARCVRGGRARWTFEKPSVIASRTFLGCVMPITH